MPMLRESPLYAYFPARDLDRARRFYEQKLGFVPKSVNDGGVTYEFGSGTAAFLYVTDNAGTSRASQAFWSVEDVDREMAELKKQGRSCRPMLMCHRSGVSSPWGRLRRLDVLRRRSGPGARCISDRRR